MRKYVHHSIRKPNKRINRTGGGFGFQFRLKNPWFTGLLWPSRLCATLAYMNNFNFIILFIGISTIFGDDGVRLSDEHLYYNAYNVLCAIESNSPIALCILKSYKIDTIKPIDPRWNTFDTIYKYEFKVNNFIYGNSNDSTITIRTPNDEIRDSANKEWYVIINKTRNKNYYNYSTYLNIGSYEYLVPELVAILNKLSNSKSNGMKLTKRELKIINVIKKLDCNKFK